jgi:predicted PurR-regulated permease PerM
MKEIFKRINHYLLFFALVVVVFYFGKTLLIPIVFAAMLAMLMAPVGRRIEKYKIKRGLSTASCILILVLVIAGVGAIVVAQFSAFAKDIDKIEKRGRSFIEQAQNYIHEKSGMTPEKQEATLKQQGSQAGTSVKSIVSTIVGTLTSAIGGMVLSLVFTFLFLYNREQYEKFFLKLYKDEDPDKVKKIVNDVSEVSQRYLTGKVMSITIIAVMYSIGLSIVGIKNAILLAGIAAILTVIPYVGTVFGGLFPVMMALVTEDSMQPALMAILVMFVIQTIDNYFIEPNIVGGEVSLNALTSILSIIAGGLLWGVAGMILFLPMVGIVKIVCDQIESLKPIGFVIGDSEGGNKSSKIKEWIETKVLKRKKTTRKRPAV